jgi:hypothetical protein
MEYFVAALVVVLTVGYAVVIAVNIEKGKSWAMEIARTASMLDPESANHCLREEAAERARASAPIPEREVTLESDRLAA